MSSQQLRTPKANDEREIANKKYKKSADDNCDSIKKQSKFKSDAEPQKNKITNYLPKYNSNQNQCIESKGIVSKETNRNEELEQQIKEKDRLINELKNKKQEEEEKVNKLLYETREYKKKAKNIIAQSIREVEELKRAERYKKNEKLGSFTENMRFFIEGEALITLRKQIDAKQQALKKLQQIKRSKGIDTEEMVRNISSFEFINRELTELRSELKLREKETAMYKDRMKLAQKEMRSLYYRECWPIVYEKYQTLELLGAGGFGQVYKCYDLELNRLTALKIIVNKDKTIDNEESDEFFKRVERQAEIQKQLSHPNIVKFLSLIELDKIESKIVFELQYCHGIELSVYLRKCQCLEEKQARSIIKQLFSAITYLFRLKSKVIHYDLKPNNIMFSDGVVKILDFGLCKVMNDNEDSRIELTSQGVGTYWYLPPETFESYEPKISSKVDVWSLGVIFFELLYGQKPFGHGTSQTQIYEKGLILKAFKPVFPKQNPKRYKISQNAIQFITLCLKYDPDDRPTPEEAFEHAYLKKD